MRGTATAARSRHSAFRLLPLFHRLLTEFWHRRLPMLRLTTEHVRSSNWIDTINTADALFVDLGAQLAKYR